MRDSGRVNPDTAQDFIDKELNNIWVRSWEALIIAAKHRKDDQPIDSWKFLKGFLSEEYALSKNNFNDRTTALYVNIASAPNRARVLGSHVVDFVKTRSVQIAVNARDFTLMEIDFILDEIAEVGSLLVNKATEASSKIYKMGQNLAVYLVFQGHVNTSDVKEAPKKAVSHFEARPHIISCRSFLSQ
jgi:hypothetical protein